MQRDLGLAFPIVSIHFSVKLTVKEYACHGTISVDNVGMLQKQRHGIYQPSIKTGFFSSIKP